MALEGAHPTDTNLNSQYIYYYYCSKLQQKTKKGSVQKTVGPTSGDDTDQNLSVLSIQEYPHEDNNWVFKEKHVQIKDPRMLKDELSKCSPSSKFIISKVKQAPQPMSDVTVDTTKVATNAVNPAEPESSAHSVQKQSNKVDPPIVPEREQTNIPASSSHMLHTKNVESLVTQAPVAPSSIAVNNKSQCTKTAVQDHIDRVIEEVMNGAGGEGKNDKDNQKEVNKPRMRKQKKQRLKDKSKANKVDHTQGNTRWQLNPQLRSLSPTLYHPYIPAVTHGPHNYGAQRHITPPGMLPFNNPIHQGASNFPNPIYQGVPSQPMGQNPHCIHQMNLPGFQPMTGVSTPELTKLLEPRHPQDYQRRISQKSPDYQGTHNSKSSRDVVSPERENPNKEGFQKLVTYADPKETQNNPSCHDSVSPRDQHISQSHDTDRVPNESEVETVTLRICGQIVDYQKDKTDMLPSPRDTSPPTA
ncbi:unnamed protein product, partial [Owenia fusiformis]